MNAATRTSGAVDPLAQASAAELVVANHILAARGVVDAFGHVSLRHPLRADRFLLARSMAPTLVTPGDILEFDLDGAAVAPGGGKPYLERFIHSELYRSRADVVAVVHSHSTAVIPFGVTAVPLRPIFHMSAFLLDPVPVFDIKVEAGDTDLLIRDAERGAALARAMGNHCAVLQRGHGSTVVGGTLHEAVFRAVYLDVNAELQARAHQLGPVTFLSPGEARLAAAAGQSQIGRAWDMWRRALGEGLL